MQIGKNKYREILLFLVLWTFLCLILGAILEATGWGFEFVGNV